MSRMHFHRAEYWTERHVVQWWRLRERENLNTAGRCGIYFRRSKIQCIWTKRFFKAHNLPQLFFCIRITRYSRNCFSPTLNKCTFLFSLFSQMGLCLIILWQHLHFLYIAIADVANDLKTNASISGVRTGSGLVVIGIILTFSFQYFL